MPPAELRRRRDEAKAEVVRGLFIRELVRAARDLLRERTPGQKVRGEFQRVRWAYFPRWDRTGHWRAVWQPRLRAAARCDRTRRRISIGPGQFDGQDVHRLRIVLVHEIALAIAGPGHGRRWQARMELAAVRAERGREPAIAAALRQEVEAY